MSPVLRQVGTGRLVVRDGGGCIAVFGLPFLLAGIAVTLISIGLLPMRTAGDMPWFGRPLMMLMGVVFTLVGGALTLGRSWTTFSAVDRTVMTQIGLLVPMHTTTYRIDDYTAVQLGFASKKESRATKAAIGHAKKAGKGIFQLLREFRGGENLEVGRTLRVTDMFSAGDRVHVTGTTKGRGFAGVIRRHGFGGFPGGHGTHEYFRHGGSIGNRSFPGRVFKGRRMAGQYGNDRVTTRNLPVVQVRGEQNLLLVGGAVDVHGSRVGIELPHEPRPAAEILAALARHLGLRVRAAEDFDGEVGAQRRDWFLRYCPARQAVAGNIGDVRQADRSLLHAQS